MNGELKTRDRANCKGQLALSVRGERRFRRIARSQRSQLLAQVATQFNDGASRTVSKWTVQYSLHCMGTGSCRPPENHCSILAFRLQVFPGQESTDTVV
ncbi:uncharacterized protein TNCV_3291181 [Trichonephila clavipes]|nr:uncharacterized protein TNCV_3291181 [Trichonephila clavipes]